MDINRRAALCLAMICPSCRNDNRPEARFCDACGQSMSAAPAPARDLRARTPKHLADKILSSGAALEGERKQVTVLFADVKGSMDLAEGLDPEEWHRKSVHRRRRHGALRAPIAHERITPSGHAGRRCTSLKSCAATPTSSG
jgi:hypothetical protein